MPGLLRSDTVRRYVRGGPAVALNTYYLNCLANQRICYFESKSKRPLQSGDIPRIPKNCIVALISAKLKTNSTTIRVQQVKKGRKVEVILLVIHANSSLSKLSILRDLYALLINARKIVKAAGHLSSNVNMFNTIISDAMGF